MPILSNLHNLPSSNSTLWKMPSFGQYSPSQNQTTDNKQPCVSSTVKRNGPQLFFFENNYNRSSNSNINHNNTG